MTFQIWPLILVFHWTFLGSPAIMDTPEKACPHYFEREAVMASLELKAFHKPLSRGMGTLVDLPSFLHREVTFMSPVLLSCTPNSF